MKSSEKNTPEIGEILKKIKELLQDIDNYLTTKTETKDAHKKVDNQ